VELGKREQGSLLPPGERNFGWDVLAEYPKIISSLFFPNSSAPPLLRSSAPHPFISLTPCLLPSKD